MKNFIYFLLTAELILSNPKIKNIDFELDNISGNVFRTDGLWVESRRQIKMGKLFKLREDFKKEIKKDVDKL